jgi:aspartyl-tRNA(Asn)/glutamyl-tRNA(Gln) amidotransferase subunit A
MLSDDVLYLSVQELSEQIRARKISPVELTESYLARLDKLGAKLGAVATITRDLAMQEARTAEKEIAAGNTRGPLHGIPYGAKDLLATDGIPTTWGAPPFKDQMFHFDATVIRKLRAAGAVLVAKLAMIELAGGCGYSGGFASLQGASRCPFNLDYWAGGSSSGPGAAVPAGLVGFAIGSETLGSILAPSSFSACSGIRPTYGRVSRHGAMALSWTMDKLGPMCRSAVDCGLVLNAISGRDAADPSALDQTFAWWPPQKKAKPLAGKRISVLQPAAGPNANAEAGAAFAKALDVLKYLGAKLEDTELPEYFYQTIGTTLYSAEAASIFRPLIENGKLLDLVDEVQKAGFLAAMQIPAADYLDTFRLRAEIMEKLGAMFEKYDVICALTFAGTGPKLDTDFGAPPRPPANRPANPPSQQPPHGETKNLIAAGNIAGLPAISVPCGFTEKENLPLGIQFCADAARDDVAIDFAAAYQSATDWHKKHPSL